ncbi:Tellurite resistance protein TehB [Halovivax ruber XH-70]|uniref:Tellurite resistance protein TehB n=1 Tax=Halovivax ruber (strain DSM 18193 / JCM 13892 / XH-70) TaxID=797302 RepID=L0ICC3_HALRX|nr:class I SAM-dependent methyltransferase [Halovivax ruber]AGB16399.1 Tellurite resistance protein TehB [Halovivax ruber XH-70]
MQYDELERIYGRDEYYWGTEPNEMAEETVDAVPDTTGTVTAIDIGAGEGRDAVFFAERGWNVYAMDVSPNGLAKAERLAARRGVTLETIEADANDTTLPESVDVVYSAGTIQYIRPENRERQFDRFKERTTDGGIHTMFAFVDHPEIPTPPDWTDNEHFYERGELAGYYEDWETVRAERFVFEDNSGGEPHRHAAETLIARNSN